MTREIDLETTAALAVEMARQAGETILTTFRRDMTVDNKRAADWDPVTAADRAAEGVIRQLIDKHFPTHGVIGEEYGTKEGQSPFTWILDPIDGTRAFIAGLPTWATLIGLYHEGRPALGVMHQAHVAETFVGYGRVAFCENRGSRTILKARSGVPMGNARVGTTSPYLYSSATESSALESLRQNCQMLRFGGDAYFFAMVAAGCLDIALDPKLQIYDIAALIPIIEGAGGVVSCWDGETAWTGGNVVAAGSRQLLDEALLLLSGPPK
jgi:myo-inositol-1(or 4)-monophosphatase